MRSLQLPEKIQDGVLDYLWFINKTCYVQQDLDQFFALISPALKDEILFYLYTTVIERVEVL